METITIQKTKINAQYFEDLTFLFKAYNPKNNTGCPNANIISTGKKVMVSDGYRIHTLDNDYSCDFIPTGQYSIITCNKKIIILSYETEKDYSFMNRYINQSVCDGEEGVINLSLITQKAVELATSYYRLIKILPENRTIEYNYFTDLVNSNGKYSVKTMSNYVIFENCTKKAYIMYINC